ncbi:Uncharacterized N-acetyltransferase SCO2625 [Geodia barretti]|uniref:Uncharacterized N-acetyltransferase SCO2625 n=1 Tax=Geodia barretti TaxID=519541 RepID=A0AA35WS96_GEOBA|nr:Uncharacterized N-acetyltransferase SCO2625 [Geodia barretti]
MEGYARYRTSGDTVIVHELMAVTQEAGAALWRFCFDTDLVTRAEAERRPVDDPLPWMLADPRRLQRAARDGLWLRLVDVATALPMRQYAEEGKVVIEVQDNVCPWNARRFALETAREGAICKATEAAPDMIMSVAALASTFLGTVTFHHFVPGRLGGREKGRVAGPCRPHLCRPAATLDSLRVLGTL